MPFAVDVPPQYPADPPAHVISVGQASDSYAVRLVRSPGDALATSFVSDGVNHRVGNNVYEWVKLPVNFTQHSAELVQDSLANNILFPMDRDGRILRRMGTAAYLDSQPEQPTAKQQAEAFLDSVTNHQVVTLTASDMVPYHGGKGLLLAAVDGAKSGINYRALGAAAAQQDDELHKRFMTFDGRASTSIAAVPGSLGVELTRMQGFAMGKLPGEKRLDQGDVWSTPSLVDVPQPLKELKVTKAGAFWTAPMLVEGWIHEVHVDKVSYSIGDAATKSYTSLSATAERSIDNLNVKARVEHGMGDNTFNVASADVKYTMPLMRGYDLALAGGGQVGSSSTAAPAMLGGGGPNRGSASPLGAVAAPSGAYGGVEVIAPPVDVLKGARPYIGVNGAVGKMSERSDVKVSAAEVGIRGTYERITWHVGVAKSLDSEATDKTRVMAGINWAF